MSKSRKFVKNNVLNTLPTPTENQTIVQVTELKGGNICEVVSPTGTKMLARVPAKFNKVIWIGRGDYLIVEPQEDVKMQRGEVKLRIIHILYKDQIQHLKSINLWPSAFTVHEKPKESKLSDFGLTKSGSDDDESDELFVNPNHVGVESSGEDEEEYSF